MPTEFGSLIPGLNSQQFDVVSAGMYINPSRCEQVLFSDPEYQMLDAFIVRKGNPKNLHTYEDIAEGQGQVGDGHRLCRDRLRRGRGRQGARCS